MVKDCALLIYKRLTNIKQTHIIQNLKRKHFLCFERNIFDYHKFVNMQMHNNKKVLTKLHINNLKHKLNANKGILTMSTFVN